MLGSLYESDTSRPNRFKYANRYYRMAAEKGNAQAMLNLGINYLSTKGGDTDHEQAVYWIEKATDAGHVMAAWALGKIYLSGRLVDMDVEKGLVLLTQAAEKDHPGACDSLSQIYRNGEYGVVPNSKQAEYWQRRADANGQSA